jgi:hypothetical protein
MKKTYTFFLLITLCAFCWQGHAQPVNSISWDFDNPAGTYGNWASVTSGDFDFTLEDGMLVIPYGKTEWHFIQVWNPNVDFPAAPFISFDVKSDSTISLSMVIKDWHDSTITETISLTAGDDWKSVYLVYRGTKVIDTALKELQFDPGWISAPDSLWGKLYFDNVRIGQAAIPEDLNSMTPYAYYAPVIDGTVDAIWNQDFINEEEVEKVTAGIMDAGFSASFKTMWDEDALYVLVEVEDSVAWINVNDEEAIKQDHSDYIDLFVDLDMVFPYTANQDNGSWWNTYDLNDFQLKFLRDSNWTEVGGQVPGRVTTPFVDFAVAEVISDDDAVTGWKLEVKIPWEDMGDFTPGNDVLVGFEIQVGDADEAGADSTRKGRYDWVNLSDNNWENPKKWGILSLYNEGLPFITTFSEDFTNPVDMDFWWPNHKMAAGSTTEVFRVTQENGALHILEEQESFADGQMYVFNDQLLDLTDNPYGSFRIKVDSGLFTDWQGLPQATIPFQLGPWGIDNVREHAVNFNLTPDGQWHRLYFDWSTPYAGGGDLSHIRKFLFESVTWPRADSVYFWIDDFMLGEAVPNATDMKSQYAYVVPEIDGTVDPVWQNLPDIEGDTANIITAGTMDDDFEATFKTLWDADALYVLVEVKDTMPFINYNDDGSVKQDHSDYIDLFVDIDRYYPYAANKDNGSWWNTYDNTDYQLKFLRDPEWGTEVGGQVPGRSTDPFVTYAVTDVVNDDEKTTGWVLEVKIPWDSMGIFTAANAKKIGFEIQVGDADEAGADSTRKGRYDWINTADNNWENPRKWGILELAGAGKTIAKTYKQDFNAPVDLNIWNAYMDSAVYLISQEENALHIQLRQTAFYQGQFYEFANWFDLSLVPYASMKIKVDSAYWTDWQALYQDWVPMGLSPWSPDGVRQHQDVWNVPVDGEWHTLYFDWSTDPLTNCEDCPGQMSLISTFLFESVTWPRGDTAYFWMDDFFVGIAALKATKADSLASLTVSEGTLDPAFAPATKIYQVQLPEGTTETPVVTATCGDANSTVVITPAADVTSASLADRTTTVVVTAQDWRVSQTYKVIFEVLTSIEEVQGYFMLYPNPASDMLYLSNASNLRSMDITNVLGQKIRSIQLSGAERYTINIDGLENGYYLINVRDTDDNIYTRRIVKRQ